jgi:hypothetical protein
MACLMTGHYCFLSPALYKGTGRDLPLQSTTKEIKLHFDYKLYSSYQYIRIGHE